MTGWVAIAGGVAAAGAIGLGLLWQRAQRRAEHLAERCDRLTQTCGELETRITREEKARKRQAEELADHRRKADKARRREAKSSAPPLGTAARIGDLEEALARAGRESERLAVENRALEERLERLQASLEAVPPPPAAVAPPAAAAPQAEQPDAGGELAAARERLRELEGRLDEGRTNEARLRKRIARQEELYAALRGELEAKKDRLRAQTEQIERLQALKVTVAE